MYVMYFLNMYFESLESEFCKDLLGVERRGGRRAHSELPPPRHLQRLSDQFRAEPRVALRRVRRQDEQLQVRVAVVPAVQK